MSEEAIQSSKRVLDEIDRTSEILFGLIMTFTCSLSVAREAFDRIVPGGGRPE
jgi:hypothetical protein